MNTANAQANLIDALIDVGRAGCRIDNITHNSVTLRECFLNNGGVSLTCSRGW